MTQETAPHDYPWTTRLNDLEVTFRLMQGRDKEAMLAFTQSLPEHDLLFLPVDITQPETIENWIADVEAGNVVTVLAEEVVDGQKGQLLGYCSLHLSHLLWIRHLGEIRMLVSSNYRGKGIGGTLARQVFAIAQSTDLHKLMVQMMSTQRDAQALFHHLGFISEALLNEWVIDRNGHMHDLIVMSREVEDVELDEDN